MIEVVGLTKKYDEKTVVDNLSFTVEPGIVTGFLGPNGAGKSTTMRMLVALETPTSGRATVDRQRYRDLEDPLKTVGALLEANAVHPRRSARNHLRWIAASAGIPDTRVDECLDLVGLTDVAYKKAGEFSLGMTQRLGIAEAMLGNPSCFLFDEPVNGLDPEGIVWFRSLARKLADDGHTILVSSHLLREMAEMADRLIVIGRGRLLADTTLEEFERRAFQRVQVRTPDSEGLVQALVSAGFDANVTEALTGGGSAVLVETPDPAQVGEIASQNNVVLHELRQVGGDIESVYLSLTGKSTEFSSRNDYASNVEPDAQLQNHGTTVDDSLTGVKK